MDDDVAVMVAVKITLLDSVWPGRSRTLGCTRLQ
jgi:hypothetical protein